jgi:hypothetical protein
VRLEGATAETNAISLNPDACGDSTNAESAGADERGGEECRGEPVDGRLRRVVEVTEAEVEEDADGDDEGADCASDGVLAADGADQACGQRRAGESEDQCEKSDGEIHEVTPNFDVEAKTIAKHAEQPHIQWMFGVSSVKVRFLVGF